MDQERREKGTHGSIGLPWCRAGAHVRTLLVPAHPTCLRAALTRAVAAAHQEDVLQVALEGGRGRRRMQATLVHTCS